jgi:hypothetical protein
MSEIEFNYYSDTQTSDAVNFSAVFDRLQSFCPLSQAEIEDI